MELVFSGIDSSGRELMPGLSGAAVREQKDIIAEHGKGCGRDTGRSWDNK